MSDTSAQDRVVSDEERARAVLEQLKSVHAFDLVYEMMVGLVSFGYQKMGLADETRPVRDLADARLAIEVLRAVLDVVEHEQGEERTGGIRDTLAQMQLAFAHAVQLANAEQAAAAEQAQPAADEATEPDGDSTESEADDADEAAEPVTHDDAAAEPAATRPAPKKPGTGGKSAAKKPAGGKKPAAGKKPAGAKKTAAKKKSTAAKKKPADEG